MSLLLLPFCRSILIALAFGVWNPFFNQLSWFLCLLVSFNMLNLSFFWLLRILWLLSLLYLHSILIFWSNDLSIIGLSYLYVCNFVSWLLFIVSFVARDVLHVWLPWTCCYGSFIVTSLLLPLLFISSPLKPICTHLYSWLLWTFDVHLGC